LIPCFYKNKNIKTMAEEEFEQFDLSKKKKKRKVVVNETEEKKEELDDDTDYDYMYLLERIRQFRPDEPASKLIIPLPNVNKLVPKKVMFVNFSDTVKVLNRPVEHIISFISSELNSDCSLDAMNRLIIRGKYGSRHLESVLKTYIIQYVVCNECKKTNTCLVKDPITRLSFVKCTDCQSSRSVENIKK
jgi:translation initiation factor 2 subunit 2